MHGAGEDLYERALSRTIFAYHAVDFSTVAFHRGSDERLHSTKRLMNIDEGQSRRSGPRRLFRLGQLFSLGQLSRLVGSSPCDLNMTCIEGRRLCYLPAASIGVILY